MLGVLFVTSAAFGQIVEYNKTDNTTCAHKDPFDEYFYHAPLLPSDAIVIDGDPSEWDNYPMLEWADIDGYCRGTGQETWSTDNDGWNSVPAGDDDFAGRFKAAWTWQADFPCLLILMEWIDDSLYWAPGAAWNASDMLQYWYGETLYDYDAPYAGNHLSGIDNDYGMRQMNVYLVEGWGIRLYKYEANPEGSNYWLDTEMQPYSMGEIGTISATTVLLEAQTQMFESYTMGLPWIVEPGYSCLAIGIAGACDYDDDESFTYWTWGNSNRDGFGDDRRLGLSLIGFEDSYDVVFGGEAVESSTWGAVKSSF
jgi:hypothetical protein